MEFSPGTAQPPQRCRCRARQLSFWKEAAHDPHNQIEPHHQIRRREPEQFRQSIESWAKQGQEAGRDGDVELPAAYPDDVADLRAILRLLESGAPHVAAEVVDCLDTLVRDQLPQRLYELVVPGS